MRPQPVAEAATVCVQHIDACLGTVVKMIHVLWSVSHIASISTSSKQNLLRDQLLNDGWQSQSLSQD